MKKSILIIIFFLTFFQPVFADIIITGNGLHYGKITEINSQSVSILEGCGNSIYTTFWDTRTRIIFNNECQPPAIQASTSPVTAEFSCDKATVFSFSFKNVNSVFYCTAIQFNGSDFAFQLFDGRKFILKNFVNFRNINSLGLDQVCKTFIKAPDIIPNWLTPY